MKPASPGILDSALVTAVATAVFYFVGLSVLSGYARAFSLPSGVFRLEVWDVVALGGKGMLSVLVSPLYVYEDGQVRWELAGLLGFTLAVLFLLWHYLKTSKYAKLTCALWLIVAMNGLASNIAMERTAASISAAHKCLSGEACSGVNHLVTLVAQKTDGATEERIGVPSFLGKSYIVIVTKAGVTVVPQERLRTLDASWPKLAPSASPKSGT